MYYDLLSLTLLQTMEKRTKSNQLEPRLAGLPKFPTVFNFCKVIPLSLVLYW